jgi:RNA polymerase sigma-B factor
VPVEPATRTRVIEDHLGLVGAVARRHGGRGEPLEDLVQVGCVALIHAVDRFDPGRGVPLAAYAAATIDGEIRSHLRDACTVVRVPRRLRHQRLALRRADLELTRILGRAPTTTELADRTGVPGREQLLSLAADGRFAGLGEGPAAALDPIAQAELRADLARALRGLEVRARRAIALRYLADLPRAQVARELGLSEVQTARVLRGALTELAGALRDPATPARTG